MPTLLKAYLQGSSDPFILAKAFLDDIILKDIQAVEQRVEKILGYSFQEGLSSWEKDLKELKGLMVAAQSDMKVIVAAIEIDPLTKPPYKSELTPKEYEELDITYEGKPPKGSPSGDPSSEFIDEIEVWVDETKDELQGVISSLGKQITTAENKIKDYNKLYRQLLVYLVEQGSDKLVGGHLLEGKTAEKSDIHALGYHFLLEEKSALMSMLDTMKTKSGVHILDLPEPKKIITIKNKRDKEFKRLSEIGASARDISGSNNRMTTEIKDILRGDKESRTSKHYKDRVKDLDTRIKQSKNNMSGSRDFTSPKVGGSTTRKPSRKTPDIPHEKFISQMTEKWGKDYGEDPKIVSSGTYGSSGFIESFVTSSSIKNKKKFIEALNSLLSTEGIKEIFNIDVFRGKKVPSGMQSSWFDKKGGKRTTKAPAAVRLQNLEKLLTLFNKIPQEYRNEPSTLKVITATESAIKDEITLIEEKEAEEKVSKPDTAKGKLFSDAKAALKRLTDGDYSQKFINIARLMQDNKFGLPELTKLSREDSPLAEQLNENIKGKTLLEHLKNVWHEEESVSEDEQSILNEIVEELHRLLDPGLESEDVPKANKSDAQRAKELLDRLNTTAQKYYDALNSGMEEKDVKKLLESFAVEYTALADLVDGLAEEVSPLQELADNPLFEIEGLENLAGGGAGKFKGELKEVTKNLAEAFKEHGINIKRETPHNRKSWIERTAKKLVEFVDDNENLTSAQVEKYVKAVLPVPRNSDYKSSGRFQRAMRDRDKLVNKILERKDIHSEDLNWVIGGKRKKQEYDPRLDQDIVERDEEYDEGDDQERALEGIEEGQSPDYMEEQAAREVAEDKDREGE